VVIRQSTRTFVEHLDFITSVGYLEGGRSRERLGLRGRGPTAVITDLGVLRPDPESRELVLTSVHQGVDVATVIDRTGWPLRVASTLTQTELPTTHELAALRELAAPKR
jgi:glutaconate CoA-transferase subunit B